MYVISTSSRFPDTQTHRKRSEMGAKRVYVPVGYDPALSIVGLWPDEITKARKFTFKEAQAFRATFGIPERYMIERI